ncbi:MAG: TlpA family protein disulfide reductase [Candidatus Thorarchaeota archaeon SMTZ1-83]
MQRSTAMAAVVLAIVAFGLGFMISGLSPYGDMAPDRNLLELEIEAPNWSMILANESSLTLHQLMGRVVLIDLMDTSCSTCITQESHLLNIYEIFQDDLWIVSLTVDLLDTPQAIANHMTSRGLPWLHGVDSGGEMAQYFNLRYLPTLIIIDAEGYVRWIHIGLWSTDDLSSTLMTIIG